MNKFKVLVALAMVLTLVTSLMLVPSFADTDTAAVEAAEKVTGEVVTDELATGEVPTGEDVPVEEAAEGDVEYVDHGDHTHVAGQEEADHAADESLAADASATGNADAGVVDHGDHTHAAGEDASHTTGDGWVTIGTSDIIAIAVAVVILGAAVFAIFLLAPKKSKQK